MRNWKTYFGETKRPYSWKALRKCLPTYSRRIALLIFLLSLAAITSAQKYNHEWLFGYDDYWSNPMFGFSKLDFNEGVVTINYWSDAGYDLGAQGSFLCDGATGEIILFRACLEI